MKMKRLIMVTMIASLCVGCSSTGTSGGGGSEADLVKKVGIVQPMDHASLNLIRECTIEGLKESGYEEGKNLEIYYENAQGDASNLASICERFVAQKVDAIIAIATPAAQTAAAITTEIPVIFDAVADPIGAKLVDDLDAPSGNVTGASHMIDVEQIYTLCKELTPEVQTFGFLYTSSEVSSQSTIEKAKEAAADFGYDYVESTISNISELQQAAEILSSQVDAIYVPNDNTIAAAMTLLGQVGREQGIPIYVGADSMVVDGGYANVGVSFETLGLEAGKMTAEILGGKKPSELPVKRFDEFQRIINQTTAELIGAPYEIENVLVVQ